MKRRTNLYKIVDQNGKPIFEDLMTAKQVAEKTGCTKNKEQCSPGSGQFCPGKQEVPDHPGRHQAE